MHKHSPSSFHLSLAFIFRFFFSFLILHVIWSGQTSQSPLSSQCRLPASTSAVFSSFRDILAFPQQAPSLAEESHLTTFNVHLSERSDVCDCGESHSDKTRLLPLGELGTKNEVFCDYIAILAELEIRLQFGMSRLNSHYLFLSLRLSNLTVYPDLCTHTHRSG